MKSPNAYGMEREKKINKQIITAKPKEVQDNSNQNIHS